MRWLGAFIVGWRHLWNDKASHSVTDLNSIASLHLNSLDHGISCPVTDGCCKSPMILPFNRCPGLRAERFNFPLLKAAYQLLKGIYHRHDASSWKLCLSTLFFSCLESSSMCRPHRIHHTRPRLHFPSDKRCTWGFSPSPWRNHRPRSRSNFCLQTQRPNTLSITPLEDNLNFCILIKVCQM